MIFRKDNFGRIPQATSGIVPENDSIRQKLQFGQCQKYFFPVETTVRNFVLFQKKTCISLDLIFEYCTSA